MADSAIWVKVYPAPPPSGSVTWAKVSGGTVTTYAKPDGSVMEVHTFTSSGDLIVQEDGYAEVLVVGGGGSGGRYANLYAGGGGGAGEVCHGNYLLPVGNVPVIVGAGGAAPTVDSRNGNRGESSSLGPIVCIGGGGGQGEANAGSTWNTSAFSGASAGGCRSSNTVQGVALAGGNVGGTSVAQDYAGGGGGQGSAGQNSTSSKGGDGGDGVSISISGAATVYAAGGGGGATGSNPSGAGGSSGVGGAGGRGGTQAAGAGAANTGSGGGGSGGANNPGAGGSGVVIVAVQTSEPTVSGVAATGGTETTFVGDGTNGVLGQTYKVHTFTADGTLDVSQGGEVDVLLVGGGGPGGNSGKAGGGAGAMMELFGVNLDAGAVPVTVGAGGITGTSLAGGHSAFGDLSAPGGGAGASPNASQGNQGFPGGSGGGQIYGGITGTALDPRYGNNAATAINDDGGTGGGGAGGPGNQRAGGPGKATSFAGTTQTFAAGGRSQWGGTAVNPVANSGNGGDYTKNGSSGIVIVRYKVEA